MRHFQRYFTLEEARAELPRLRDDLQRLQTEIRRLQDAHAAAEPAIAHADGNGGSAAAGKLFAQQNAVARIVEAIQARGIQIKDPRQGLVDFPHWRDGKEVLLCWLLGEQDIEYWHDLESGFMGRHPI
ncbi:MAG TPA: DUF2203 domain-containing protein [Armatimonadota bacterium]|nr:DUF2203 domain-containing protein [Armatimonadota bacterium]